MTKRSTDRNDKRKTKKSNTRKNNSNIDDIIPSLFFILNDLPSSSSPEELKPESPKNVCPGKFCDHDAESTNVPKIPSRLLSERNQDYRITLSDLIDLGKCYHCKLQKTFGNVSLERLAILHDSLDKLHKIIGMKLIKENFAEQIIYFLLDLEPNPAEMLHTILEGPPGVGKTMVIDILAEIYLKMGYLTKNVIKKVKINDLKGKYIGHTAPLTQEAINQAMGGVLVIDEAYSLTSGDYIDSFSQELIDTLNRNLTENAGKFVCIIAGYGDQIDKRFLSQNPGLSSRFRFRFAIETYESNDLKDIFCLKVADGQWKLHDNIDVSQLERFFKDNYSSFKYFGRDMETLLFHTKVAHCNRVFFESRDDLKKITMEDIELGYQRFSVNLKKEELPLFVKHLYT